jgi:tetratricopeptide (TPR) repeat protein
MLLSLAYLVAAWGQWELALKFADLALTRRRLSPNIPANEGRFFKALCLRMLGAETGAHYREARRLLQQARVEKRRQTGSVDPRYVKEMATLLFQWGEVLSREGGASAMEAQRKEDTAVRLSHRALELARDNPSLTSQIYNNLCYYFTNNPALAGGGEIRTYLDRLDAQLDQSAPERWPINFVDTVLWAHCNLRDTEISSDYARALINTLERALREQRIRDAEQQSIRKHLARARQQLGSHQRQR